MDVATYLSEHCELFTLHARHQVCRALLRYFSIAIIVLLAPALKNFCVLPDLLTCCHAHFQCNCALHAEHPMPLQGAALLLLCMLHIILICGFWLSEACSPSDRPYCALADCTLNLLFPDFLRVPLSAVLSAWHFTSLHCL